MHTLGTLTAAVLVTAYCAIVRGVVFSVLWSWFVVTKFNLPGLSITEAIGLMIVVLFFSSSNYDKKEEETLEQSMWSSLSRVTIRALVGLGIGFITKLFL